MFSNYIQFNQFSSIKLYLSPRSYLKGMAEHHAYKNVVNNKD